MFDGMPPLTPDNLRYYDDVMADMINEGGQGDDGQDTQDHETEGQESVNVEEEPLFGEELSHQAWSQKRRQSVRTGAYTKDEDKLLCEAWMKIEQDPQTSTEQKGSTFWKRVHAFFHEHRKFEPHKLESDRGDLPLQKRSSFIQLECNKFCGSYEHVVGGR